MEMRTCVHCGKGFHPNPRVKKQRYCRAIECQRARKTEWQREKIARDKDYKDNQIHFWKEWIAAHPAYWREYRAKHPEYTARNRDLQSIRDAKKCKDRVGKILAKMDSLAKEAYRRGGNIYKLIPQDDRILAKMDSLTVRVIPLSRMKRIGGL